MNHAEIEMTRFPFMDAEQSKIFDNLPKILQDKLLAPYRRQLTAQQKIEEENANAQKTGSITPAKFRSRKALANASEATMARAESGVEAAPFTNRGVTMTSSIEARELLQIVPLGKHGKFEIIRIPKAHKGYSANHAFIDWVNFTFKTADLPLSLSTGHQALTDYEYVQGLSVHLFDIFGYGVKNQRESGMNFYKSSFDVGENGWGLVCIGGQKDSCSVTIKGQGLLAAQPGWEKRLHDFLKTIRTAKITRLDLASDDFYCQHDISHYRDLWRSGLFNVRGKSPNIETVGNWEAPNGKGRTLYIGSRDSGKLLRIYEKGKQIGRGYAEKYPRWIRTELELKNDSRVIPFDALLRPGQYLAGAYPALAPLAKVQKKIETFRKTAQTTVEAALECTRIQFGRYIWSAIELLGVDKAIETLTRDREDVPKRLQSVLHFQVNHSPADYMQGDPILTFPTGAIPV